MLIIIRYFQNNDNKEKNNHDNSKTRKKDIVADINHPEISSYNHNMTTIKLMEKD